ncbi:hypothetical protein HYW42_05295 [Candidatus Daviesbacteria bacterium]|nr:hypothetical protein [Candidatus Daviesbacteria bacterium]
MEIRSNIRVPEVLSTRFEAAVVCDGINQGYVALGSTALEGVSQLKSALEDPRLSRLIHDQKVTLGLIKPQPEDPKKSRQLPENDDQAAAGIMDEIGRERIMTAFSLKLTPEQAETFYIENKDKLKKICDPVSNVPVWQRLIEFTTSGPLTVLLIHDEGGDAVQWWREQMGATKPEDARPESIRGRHAVSAPENWVHGSDSPRSVRRELTVVRLVLSDLLARSIHNSEHFLPEEFLRWRGILESDDELLYQKLTSNSVAPGWGEHFPFYSFGSSYEVQLIEANGSRGGKYLHEESSFISTRRFHA